MNTVNSKLGRVTNHAILTSGKATAWASQDNQGYPCIGFVDWDNPG